MRLHALTKFHALTLLWFYLSKPFKICLLAKWLSICLNLSKPSTIFCYCTTTPFNTLWKDLKGRKIGLWYVCSESCFTFQNLSYVPFVRQFSNLSKPFSLANLKGFERSDNSMAKCTEHKRVNLKNVFIEMTGEHTCNSLLPHTCSVKVWRKPCDL